MLPATSRSGPGCAASSLPDGPRLGRWMHLVGLVRPRGFDPRRAASDMASEPFSIKTSGGSGPVRWCPTRGPGFRTSPSRFALLEIAGQAFWTGIATFAAIFPSMLLGPLAGKSGRPFRASKASDHRPNRRRLGCDGVVARVESQAFGNRPPSSQLPHSPGSSAPSPFRHGSVHSVAGPHRGSPIGHFHEQPAIQRRPGHRPSPRWSHPRLRRTVVGVPW